MLSSFEGRSKKYILFWLLLPLGFEAIRAQDDRALHLKSIVRPVRSAMLSQVQNEKTQEQPVAFVKQGVRSLSSALHRCGKSWPPSIAGAGHWTNAPSIRIGEINFWQNGTYAPFNQLVFAPRLFSGFAAAVDLRGIPFSASWRQASPEIAGARGLNDWHFDFGRSLFLQQIKERIANTFSPAALIHQYKQVLQVFEDRLKQELRRSIDSIAKSATPALRQSLLRLSGEPDIFQTGILELRGKLFSPALARELEDATLNAIKRMQESNDGQMGNSNKSGIVLNADSIGAQVHFIQEKLERAKQLLAKNGIRDQISQLEAGYQMQVLELVHDPSKIIRMARSLPGFTMAQQLFAAVSQFSLGNSTTQWSPLSVDRFLGNGINLGLTAGQSSINIISSGERSFNPSYGRPFSSNLTNAATTGLLGLRWGHRSSSGSEQFLSISRFKPGRGSVAGTGTVITFTSSQQIGRQTTLAIDLSRSALYHTIRADEPYQLSAKHSGSNLSFGDQLAAYLQLHGSAGSIAWRFTTSIAGMGYNNPGSSFTAPGRVSFAGQLSGRLLSNRLQFSVSPSFNRFRYTAAFTGSTAFGLNSQLKWRFSKGQSVFVTYAGMSQALSGAAFRSFRYSRFTLGGNYQSVVKGFRYRHQLNMVAYCNSSPILATAPSSTFWLQSLQSVSRGSSNWFLDCMYRAGKMLAPIPTWTISAGNMFLAARILSVTAGMCCTKTAGSNLRVSLQQSLSLAGSGKINLLIHSDLAILNKDIDPQGYYGNRVDWQFNYHFK